MLFNSIPFLLFFLPFVLFIFYFLLPRSLRIFILVGASIAFYAVSSYEHAAILVICIAWVYFFTQAGARVSGRLIAAAAMFFPLASLFYYKYSAFFFDSLAWTGLSFEFFENAAAQVKDKALPAGISFFAFELASFAIDRFRKQIASQPDIGIFALFVAFFPHLVAGPIVRFNQITEDLQNLPNFRPTAAILREGALYLISGLSMKVLLADNLARSIAAHTGQESIYLASGIYVVLAYSFQIYLDFYGYSLMAIGLGIFFGVRFPRNFDRPYESLNPRDFWRRWHMTLSLWIRDYLYLPLGGNRSYVRNILIVFAACGLWHGAGWNFVVWGLYHAFLVVFLSLFRQAVGCSSRNPANPSYL